MSEKIRIYVATHKPTKLLPKDDIYTLLEVGAYNKPKFCVLRDNTGDNISEKNSSYCELTGLYWIWKNTNDDISGLCHYRRFFVKRLGYFFKVIFGINSCILKRKDIEKTIPKYDAIITRSSRHNRRPLGLAYYKSHCGKDLEVVKDIIKRRYPEYVPAMDEVLSSKIFHYGNTIICKKSVLDGYCEWLFDILFEAEKSIDVSTYDSYQKRQFGFLSERFLKIWLVTNNIKYKEYDLINTEDPCAFIWWLKRKLKKA